MSWINKDSYELIKTEDGKEFSLRNNLKSNGDLDGANFFNDNVLIKIYEERSFLHADYYDLKNFRWCRELENHLIETKIIPVESAQEIFSIAKRVAKPGCLKQSSMVNFIYYLKMIETHMQDFLNGNLYRYETFLKPLEDNHKLKITGFKRKFLK